MTTDVIVETDDFATADLEQMLGLSPKLRSAFDDIADATPTGEGLGPDLWSSLLRIAPRKIDEIPPRLRLNETVIEQVWDAEQYKDLHVHTMGDPINAAAGVAKLASKVTGMLAEMGDVAEQAEKAQAAQDALEQAMGGGEPGGDGEPTEGDSDQSLEEELESLRSEAETESARLDEMIDDKLPQIDSAVRAGIEEAEAEADANAQACTAWGMEPGEAGLMDPTRRLKMLTLMSDERMRRIADLVGLMLNLALGQRDRKYEYRPGEVVGVTLGSSLARLVPGELASLGIPEMEDLLLLRLAKGRARNYLTRTVERAGRGAIVFLGDMSTSMEGPKGDWCVAFALALLRVARAQGRAFHAIYFRGPGKWDRFDFTDPRANVTEQMLEFASQLPDGGTEITGPLDEAVGLLQAEYDKGGNIEGDIVLATDGEVRVPMPWLVDHTEKREALGFHTYGLAIKANLTTLRALCTHVGDVTDLTSGKDVADVFATVQ
jgi:uncharacterized protein with von Willebrand factor type A (vWA) domain